MPAVLFVCTGNQFRSPVAAACMRRLLKDRGLTTWQVESAGTWTIPGQSALTVAAEAARSVGVDLSAHTTRLVNAPMLAKYDLVLTMERGQAEALRMEFPSLAPRVHLLSEMADGLPYDIPDPLSQPDQQQQILAEMCAVIERGLPHIVEVASAAAGGTP